MTAPLKSIRLESKPGNNFAISAGRAGEIFYDIANNTLRVFDGRTTGGNIVSTRPWVDTQVTNAIATEVTNRNTAITGAITSAIATEVTNRNTAITSAIATEVTNRNTAITSAIATEVTNRNTAIIASLSGYATAASVSSAIANATYTLPTASTTVLGGVKVDGSTITISNGVISSSGSSGGTSLPSQTGNAGKVLSTNGSTVSWSDVSGQAAAMPAGTVLRSLATTAPSGYVELSSTTPDSSPVTTINGVDYSNSEKYPETTYPVIDVSGIAGIEGMYTAVSLGSNRYLLIYYTGYAVIESHIINSNFNFSTVHSGTVVHAWQSLPGNMPYANMAVVDIGSGQYLLFGLGATQLWKYTASTNTFTTVSLTGANQPTYFGPSVWLTGTYDYIWYFDFNSNKVWKIHKTTLACTQAATIPAQFQNGNGSWVSGCYAAGNYYPVLMGLGASTKKVARYDLDTDTFTQTVFGGGATYQDSPVMMRWGAGDYCYNPPGASSPNLYHPMASMYWITTYAHGQTKSMYIDSVTGEWKEIPHSPPMNHCSVGVGTFQGGATLPTAGIGSSQFFPNRYYSNKPLIARYFKT